MSQHQTLLEGLADQTAIEEGWDPRTGMLNLPPGDMCLQKMMVSFRDHTLRTPRLDHTGPERYRERTELPANNLANAKTPLLWDGP